MMSELVALTIISLKFQNILFITVLERQFYS